MPIEKVNKIVQEGTMMSGNRLIRWKMERKWIFEGEKSQIFMVLGYKLR